MVGAAAVLGGVTKMTGTSAFTCASKPLFSVQHSDRKLRETSVKFLLTMSPRITHEGHENKGNDHLQNKLLIVAEFLLISTLGNILRTAWRIYILMLGC